MISRLRSPVTVQPTTPFWFKTFYDLSQPGDKADISRLLNRVIYRSNPNMRASHRTVLAFIFDRTIGWDKIYERITYTQFLEGVFDKNGVQVAHGTHLSRRTLTNCLSELISWGVVLRRIETGCKGEPKYFYALNLGANVGVKNRDGSVFTCRGVSYLESIPNLFQSEKLRLLPQPTVTETVFVNGKVVETPINESMSMPIPKRLRHLHVQKEPTFDEIVHAEFGEEPKKAADVNSPQFTLTGLNPLDQFNSDTVNTHNSKDTEPKNTETEAAGAAATPVVIEEAMEELNNIVHASITQWEENKSVKMEGILEKSHVPIAEIEKVWATAYKEVFGSLPIPWGGKQKGQMKQLQKKWLASERVQFGRAVDYMVRKWEEIGALYFNVQASEGPDGGKYPNRPELGYLVVCMSTFTRAYDDQNKVESVPGMSKKDLFIARLQIRGYEEGKIAALVDQKFKPKPVAEKVDHKGWEQMLREKGRQNLQPVAIEKIERHPDNVISFDKAYSLEEWK